VGGAPFDFKGADFDLDFAFAVVLGVAERSEVGAPRVGFTRGFSKPLPLF
jgi:hypothetical protein